jgi:hypothetical protein
MRSFIFVFISKYHYADQVRENYFGEAYRAHWREKSVGGFGGKSRKKIPLGKPRRRLEDGNKMDLREIGWGCRVDSLAQDRDQWRVLVNNLRVLAPCS